MVFGTRVLKQWAVYGPFGKVSLKALAVHEKWLQKERTPGFYIPWAPSIYIYIYIHYLLWGVKYITMTNFGLFGAPGICELVVQAFGQGSSFWYAELLGNSPLNRSSGPFEVWAWEVYDTTFHS